eukprot:jgi/Mesvir1/19651/Mv09933-RA.3
MPFPTSPPPIPLSPPPQHPHLLAPLPPSPPPCHQIRQRSMRSPADVVALGVRGFVMVTSLANYALTHVLDSALGRQEDVVQRRSKELRELLVSLGPSFIKAGQVLANRPDILRADYMTELATLQDDVPQFPDEEAYRIIEREMGRPISAVFSQLSPKPIAAASLGQVYRGRIRSDSPVGAGMEVAVKVQRPGIEPLIMRDLFLFRVLAQFFNTISLQRLGCNAELIVDEFGEKLLEELDYTMEARNIADFLNNFKDDPKVKIPIPFPSLSSSRVLVMEWIDGIRCTDPDAIRSNGINVNAFITTGVSSGLRQLLEFGLFHGDPHPGNIFCMRDGRIAYVDFGNVAELSQANKECLIDAVVHAVNEDYEEMAGDFMRLGFLAQGTDITPIVPALEKIWRDSTGKSLDSFNFRTVTQKFNELVYEYPIRIPERFSLVIRSLLTQEGICLALEPRFKFLEVAYPYIAKRLLTDPDPALRGRLLQILFRDESFQWKRLENLITLASEGAGGGNAGGKGLRPGLDLSDTMRDGARVVLTDASLRRQLLMAFTEGERLHIKEVQDVLALVQPDIKPEVIARDLLTELPKLGRDWILSWSDRVLAEN